MSKDKLLSQLQQEEETFREGKEQFLSGKTFNLPSIDSLISLYPSLYTTQHFSKEELVEKLNKEYDRYVELKNSLGGALPQKQATMVPLELRKQEELVSSLVKATGVTKQGFQV